MGESTRRIQSGSLLIAFALLALIMLVVSTAVGCGSTSTSSSSLTTMTTIAPNSTVVTQSSGANAQGPGATVTLHNGAVNPTELQVQVGTGVKFVDADDDNTRTYQLVSDDGAFDTGVLGESDSSTITFQKPGTISFHDKNDPNIKVTIVVQ